MSKDDLKKLVGPPDHITLIGDNAYLKYNVGGGVVTLTLDKSVWEGEGIEVPLMVSVHELSYSGR